MKQARYKSGHARGQLTIFLSLLLMLVISVLLALSESTLIQLAKGESRSISYMALDSVFGEFHKELLEEYDVLFIDAGYRTGHYSQENILNRYQEYVSYECHMGKGLSTLGTAVNWHLALQDPEITALELATDDCGAPLRAQICAYMEEKTGLGLIRDITGVGADLKEKAEIITDSEEAYEALRIDEQAELEAASRITENAMLQKEVEEEALTGDPIGEVTELRRKGVLESVLKGDMELSPLTIPIESLPSHRALKKGYGAHPWETERSRTADTILFREYLQTELSCYTDAEEARGLQYELEYLIAGKASDRDNLKSVLERLLVIRMAENFLYLQTDTGRRGQAEAAAVIIATLAGVPETIEGVQQALLIGWAYGESLVELRSLLQGGQIPLYPTAANWQVSLGELMYLDQLDGRSGTIAAQGMDYKDWLHVLLYMGSTDQQTMRFMDLVETNVHIAQGDNTFALDSCVAGLTIHNNWILKRGIGYELSVSYGYQ